MGLLDDVRKSKRKEQTGPTSGEPTRAAPFRAASPVLDAVDDQAVTSPKMPVVSDAKKRLTAMTTREVDLTGAAKKSLEVDSTPQSAAIEILEAPVQPVPKPVVAQPSVEKPAQEAAPSTSDGKGKTEEKEEVSEKAVAEAVEEIKSHVDSFLGKLRQDVMGKLEEISSTLENHTAQLEERENDARNVADELEGSDPETDGEGTIITDYGGDVVEKNNDGEIIERTPSIRKHLTSLQEGLNQATGVLQLMLGKDFGSLKFYREAIQQLAEKQLLRALSIEDSGKRLKNVEKSAWEIGPEMAKLLLEKYSETHEIDGQTLYLNLYVRLSTEKRLQVDSTTVLTALEEPKNAEIKKFVLESAPKFGKRAEESLQSVNWERCEKKNRKHVFGGDQ